jgi:hypothetical protein
MSLRKLICATLALVAFINMNAIAASKSKIEENRQITKNTNTKRKMGISPFVGMRSDKLQWSISGAGLDKLSELTWENKVAEIGVEMFSEPTDKQYNFWGMIKYGKILEDSKNQDSDWDEISEFSRTFSKVQGNTFDISAAFGNSSDVKSRFPYAFITHYFGIDYNYVNNRNFGLKYVINRQRHTNILDATGQLLPTTKLVSTYKYQIYAPWYGLNLDYKINNKFSFSSLARLYLFAYKSEADWVLRTDFAHDPSFIDRASGFGFSIDAKFSYNATKNLDLYANLGIKQLSLGAEGTQTTFFNNNTYTIGRIKTLRVITKTASIGAKYSF